METKSSIQATSSKFGAGVDCSELPEACIASILAWTSPRDACRMSTVSPEFQRATESDALWETFLPADYQEIIGRSSESSARLDFSSKKELFFRLCNSPLLIDGGEKSFWLDKESGKKCYMIAARELTIIWSETPSYWTWISLPHSRFTEVANLNIVCWFDIKGKMNTCMLSPCTNYAAYLIFQRKDKFYGFKDNPIESSIGVTGGETTKKVIYLDPEHDISPNPTRIDGWYEVELGEFFNEGRESVELEMSIMEVSRLNGKSGLLIEGIEIRPKFCS